MILTGGGMHEKAMHHVIGTVPVAPIIRLREVAEQVVAAYLESLTAVGPVILLPDEGDGVKVAKLRVVLNEMWGDADLDGSNADSFVFAAREVAE